MLVLTCSLLLLLPTALHSSSSLLATANPLSVCVCVTNLTSYLILSFLMFRGHKGKERREIFIAAAAMQTIVKPLADLLSELIEDDAKAELVSHV